MLPSFICGRPSATPPQSSPHAILNQHPTPSILEVVTEFTFRPRPPPPQSSPPTPPSSIIAPPPAPVSSPHILAIALRSPLLVQDSTIWGVLVDIGLWDPTLAVFENLIGDAAAIGQVLVLTHVYINNVDTPEIIFAPFKTPVSWYA